MITTDASPLFSSRRRRDDQDSGRLAHNQRYGCVPFRMDHIIAENYRNRASVVAVLATLLNSSPPGLDSDGNFDLGRASPGLMDGKKAGVTNASSFGPKGGVWRKIADEEAEVTEENKDGWIHCLVKILDGPILLAPNKKDASISIRESKKKGEKVPTSVVYTEAECNAVNKSRTRLGAAADMLANGVEENVYGDNLDQLLGDISMLGKARYEAGLCRKLLGLSNYEEAIEIAGRCRPISSTPPKPRLSRIAPAMKMAPA